MWPVTWQGPSTLLRSHNSKLIQRGQNAKGYPKTINERPYTNQSGHHRDNQPCHFLQIVTMLDAKNLENQKNEPRD